MLILYLPLAVFPVSMKLGHEFRACIKGQNYFTLFSSLHLNTFLNLYERRVYNQFSFWVPVDLVKIFFSRLIHNQNNHVTLISLLCRLHAR